MRGHKRQNRKLLVAFLLRSAQNIAHEKNDRLLTRQGEGEWEMSKVEHPNITKSQKWRYGPKCNPNVVQPQM
jgi:hypothetical protein